jgi:hypothetical protein
VARAATSPITCSYQNPQPADGAGEGNRPGHGSLLRHQPSATRAETPTTNDPGSSNAVSDAPQDAFARWAALPAWSADATNRLDEQDDLGFWERIAPAYDEGALRVRVPAVIEPHDVVLAANASHRTLDLRRALRKMIDPGRQRGIIVWSVGCQDAPQQGAREQIQPARYRPGPDYVDDTHCYLMDAAAAEGLRSWNPISVEDQLGVSRLLPHLLERDGHGWRWRRRGRIAVIWWDGPAMDDMERCSR